jgi:hypothetical protein
LFFSYQLNYINFSYSQNLRQGHKIIKKTIIFNSDTHNNTCDLINYSISLFQTNIFLQDWTKFSNLKHELNALLFDFFILNVFDYFFFGCFIQN